MRTVLVTGGTGLIGRRLVKHLLSAGCRIIILSREIKNTAHDARISYARWNIHEGTIDEAAVCSADAIIHLAGAGVVDKKWTSSYKKEILNSRVKSSELLISTLAKNKHSVKTIISASATGWYGADKIPGHSFTENEKADGSFLGEVCRQWEESIYPAEALGIRVCCLRTGIVLDGDGGAYAEFRKPLKFGIAAILGSGLQMVSWIHVDDLCRQYIYALQNESVQGSYNAVAPMPVNNKTLTLEIAKAAKGKFFLPMHVPSFVLKIMLGGRSIEILKSTTVSAKKIQDAGFRFLFSNVASAVRNIESE